VRWLLPFVVVGLAFAQGKPPVAPKKPGAKKGKTKAAPEAIEGTAPLTPDDIDALDPERPLGQGARLRIFKQAQARRRALDRREKLLLRRIKRLEAVQADVQSRYKTLRMLQEELVALSADDEEDRGDEEAEKRRQAEEKVRKKRVRKLAAEFNKMKPDAAAKVTEQMDQDLSVEILLRLKDRQAAKILGKLQPKLAAKFSEDMAQQKKKKRKRARKAR